MASEPTKKATTKKVAAKKTAVKKTAAKKATKAATKAVSTNQPVTPVPAVEKPAPVKEAPATAATPVKKTTKKAVRKSAAKKASTPSVTQAADAPTTTSPAPRSGSVTTVVCKVDIGYGNQLYIRGEGNGLSWDQGVLMENCGADEWCWSSNQVEGELTFKVLLNDTEWQQGDDQIVLAGATISFSPSF
ncbi:MAG: hypothetical protein Q7P63_02930 [Verrucomicrobiota bacterium JB022]|nr:hypothetical protein [Verrucomicrobiota bacterium JB022]